mmetsp:Transcript_16291/g.35671  ORF Transcript_16291/g.35671 Transcript_16291/m.35671 type:complete len:854 (-) Transcript_16291:107-2668(-)|eukprot:CAMPEP_0170583182 /NCGR_PEP_ID=MMETSP0224-20130122/7990_1 /TAXON_ID=285029 /ORGANISM="Togula jolla, Strain CCCM 725" /LENGTH=853 /DNA_ID=CAMNT_0010906475 /DNA_START=39 /DNA_END=2600 /DNA_ORIENTATION=+
MGGAESVVRNVDKRASRREHRASFEEAITRFRARTSANPEAPRDVDCTRCRGLRVCIRKRPLFPHERQQGEFDVISCVEGSVVVHDARMQADMRNMYLNHHDFSFDAVFDEAADNNAVYVDSASETVRSVAAGGWGTIMMYGQTGSGKTYTMTSFYERAASQLFGSVGSREVTVSFIELLGDACVDMLNGGRSCRLAAGANGSVHPHPCVEVGVADAAELLSLVQMAVKLRATAATGVHDQSSRSHFVCRIFVSGEGETDEEGCLTLVDLAGTEHRVDSAEHNAQRQREGAQINASLAALKDCVRAAAAGSKFVAYRQNRLTQLLRNCFAQGSAPHPTTVIATVSPSSKDTEQSLNTLRHACIMDGQGEKKAGQSTHLTGGVVTKEPLGEIDVTRIARERIAAGRSGRSANDKLNIEKPRPAHQSKESNLARRECLDRQCLQSLPQALATRIMEARQVRWSERQRIRLRGPGATAEDFPSEVISLADDAKPLEAASEETMTAAPTAAEVSEPRLRRLSHCSDASRPEDADDYCRRLPTPRALDTISREVPAEAARSPELPPRPAMRSPATRARDVSPSAAADRGRGHMAVPEARDCVAAAPAATAPSPEALPQDSIPPGVDSGEQAKALDLFSLFCAQGREAQAWRKNDLRLINNCILPTFFGPSVQIDWAHPNAALDELDRLVAGSPALNCFGSRPASSVAQVPRLRARQAAPQGSTAERGKAQHLVAGPLPVTSPQTTPRSHTRNLGNRQTLQRDDVERGLPASEVPVPGDRRSPGRPVRQAPPSSIPEAAREPARHIADKERQAATAEADVRRWMAELRAGASRDAAGTTSRLRSGHCSGAVARLEQKVY